MQRFLSFAQNFTIPKCLYQQKEVLVVAIIPSNQPLLKGGEYGLPKKSVKKGVQKIARKKGGW